MSRIARDITWLIGHTPLVELGIFAHSTRARVVAKLENRNPSNSNKDRAVLAMVEHAERHGYLQPGGTILECSAGDLSVALAMVAARRGYRLVLTMPEGTCPDRVAILRTLGAEIVFTDRKLGTRGALARLEELSKQLHGAHVLQPFANRANARAHEATAREIWEDTDGEVDAVVCPVGTGGTAAGCLAFFRHLSKRVAVLGVEPATSAVLSGAQPGPHGIPGLGAGFIPEILHADELAEVIAVADEEADAAVRQLAVAEGLLVGPASGAVLHAARAFAERPENAHKLVVAILPDHAERYVEAQ